MKKLLVLLSALLWAASAFAQYVPEWYQGDLKKKGTVLALQGEKLDRETTEAILNQVGGPDMVDDWNNYRKERGWGIGLTSGGYTLAAAGFCYGGVYLMAGIVGTIFVAIGGQEAVDKMWADLGPQVTIGGIAMFTGLAVGTTGVVLLCVGNGNMRKTARLCNDAGLPVPEPLVSPMAELTFGPTPSGVGLALRF
jgi:hypothetical protein